MTKDHRKKHSEEGKKFHNRKQISKSPSRRGPPQKNRTNAPEESHVRGGNRASPEDLKGGSIKRGGLASTVRTDMRVLKRENSSGGKSGCTKMEGWNCLKGFGGSVGPMGLLGRKEKGGF